MDHSGELMDNVVDVAFYRDLNLRQLTIDLWKEVANRYKGNPAVAGYDILNEPGEKNGLTQNYHWEYFNQVYEGIRSVDPDHIVIFESCWTQNDLPQPSVYGWENVIYQFHHYAWDYQSDVEGQIKEVDIMGPTIRPNSISY
jgi:aryl-phospho-beta-D-glucosidase BglC (GH1 family)